MRKFLFSVALVGIACTSERVPQADTAVLVTRPSETARAAVTVPPRAPQTAPPLVPELQAAVDSAASALPSAASAANDPAAALTRYLAYAAFRGAPSIGSDGLSACPPIVPGEDDVDEGWEPDDYVGFVLPRVLGATMEKADTTRSSATGRAEVTRVVKIGRDSVGWVGSLEARLDTLTWTLQRGPTGWAVCGPAIEVGPDGAPGEMAFDLTYDDALRTVVSSAHWLPAGTTWPAAAAHADSVLQARR